MGKELFAILQSSSLFYGLSNEQIDRLVNCGLVKAATYKRNDILFWTDKAPDKLYVLLSGNIAMAKDTLSGKRSLSKSNTIPGELIGEVRLFSKKKLLWEYAIALENSAILEIASRVFMEQGAIEGDIQTILLRNIIGNVVDKIDNLGQKVRILSVPSVRSRIALYLISIQDSAHHMVLKSTREEIADYIGVARPSLSRELGRMQDDGIIRIEGKEVFVANQEAFDALYE